MEGFGKRLEEGGGGLEKFGGTENLGSDVGGAKGTKEGE